MCPRCGEGVVGAAGLPLDHSHRPPPPPLTVELCPGRPGRLASVTWAFISLTRLLITNPLSLWHLSVRFGGEPE